MLILSIPVTFAPKRMVEQSLKTFKSIECQETWTNCDIYHVWSKWMQLLSGAHWPLYSALKNPTTGFSQIVQSSMRNTFQVRVTDRQMNGYMKYIFLDSAFGSFTKPHDLIQFKNKSGTSLTNGIHDRCFAKLLLGVTFSQKTMHVCFLWDTMHWVEFE